MTAPPPSTGIRAASEYLPLEGLPIPVAILRADRVAYANAALTALLGISQEALSQLSMSELLSRFVPKDQPWIEPRYQAQAQARHLQSAPTDLWLHVRGVGGKERTFHLRVHSGPGPGEQTVVLVDAQGEDTAQQLIGALVIAASEMMVCQDETGVLERALDAISAQGFFASILHARQDLFVYGPVRHDPEAIALLERLVGQPLADYSYPRARMPHLDALFQQRKATFHPEWNAVLRRLFPSELAEFHEHKHPGLKSLDVPIFVEGQPYGVLSVKGRSLTIMSTATLELFAQMMGGALENVRHHQRAQERLAELTRLQNELVAHERITVLGEAAGVVAHEVRNPLGAILNATALLKREEQLSAVGHSAVSMLEEEAIRLEDIVRDLLDVVRPFELRPRMVHLGDLARHTVTLLQPVAEASQARVVIDEEPDLPPLQADETLMQLALSNLVRYALRSSPEGGTVRMVLARAAKGLSISVEDQGASLSHTDTQRFFEPFFTSRNNGAGLGLAVVRRVVLAHGGDIQASERSGGGARFELLLQDIGRG
ncbi:His Kinase A (phospho-acceptor) domain-containing protein [Stigmatella aurantiaca]|uniref:histidine kinase n=1 Tax=Stigmatella aurantiaca TaxID=41 RepID=A0A1H7SR20_STIAU|nr:ATP-binding protein [Stigmatella aurantiaca]SEL74908.1 His Kinase A (phospho-acceptor) domain-containing protein [Stigmatella aurantiaca]